MPRVDELMYGYKHIVRKIIEAGQVKQQIKWCVQEYSLLIVTAGAGQLLWNEGQYELTQGSCFIAKPDHECEIESRLGAVEIYRIIFAPLPSSATTYTDALPCDVLLSCYPFSRCLELAEGIFRIKDAQDMMSEMRRHILLQEFLMMLIAQGVVAGTDWHQHIRQSLRYIQEHYNLPLTVDDLADHANMERWRYARMFKQVTGKTPLDYISQLRMSRAKQLLSGTEDRMFDIASHVGLSNEYYFSKKFKKSVGVSPGQYRRQCRDHVRVFSPFMEDYLVALGIVPVVQSCHAGWGKQDYLGLNHIPELDIEGDDPDRLSVYKPDVILLESASFRWKLNEYQQIAHHITLSSHSENWRQMLVSVAEMFGKTSVAEEMIAQYEHQAAAARSTLERRVQGQTVAMLRLSSCGFTLYGGEKHGYTGPVLYGDLALEPHSLVRQLTKGARKAELTAEQLGLLDADHIFITFDNEDGQKMGLKYLSSPVWNSLRAVQNKRVYEVDFLSWMNYGLLSNRKKINDVLHFLG